MSVVRIDGKQICSWSSFHTLCAKTFGFPGCHGRNMDAWIDCMTSLDAPDDGMTTTHVVPPEVLVLQLDHADDLKQRCPGSFEALLKCSAFVNFRKLSVGEPAVLALSFDLED